MALIIAATDFSAVGEHAVKYACEIAMAQSAELLVIHTFIMPVMFTDIPVPNNLTNDAQKDADAQTRALLDELALSYPGLAVKGKVVYGDVADAINENNTGTEVPWLVIIGNNNVREAISIDSTLMETFKNSRYPVLAVPPAAAYKPVKKICFAFDNKYKGSDLALLQLRDLQQQLQAELHVLYAQAEGQGSGNSAEIEDVSKTILAAANPHYHFMYNASVEGTIKTFIAENDMDWLVVMPRKHSFIDGLFHKSHSKAMAHEIHIPILALHENV